MILGCGLMPKDWLGNFFNLAYREVILPAARDRGVSSTKSLLNLLRWWLSLKLSDLFFYRLPIEAPPYKHTTISVRPDKHLSYLVSAETRSTSLLHCPTS